MQNLAVKSFIALFFLHGSAAFAEDDINVKPPVDGYGYDWLHPETAQCAKMTDALLQKLKACRHEINSGFTATAEVFNCRVDDDSEYLIFANESVCKQELETMEANAP